MGIMSFIVFRRKGMLSGFKVFPHRAGWLTKGKQHVSAS